MEEMHKAIECEFDICDFSTTKTENLKTHIKDNHTFKCKHCDVTFLGERKLEKHTCRIKISNPEYFDMYMKNWYIKDKCIPIFSRKLKKEVILLHSELCWENENSCTDIPLNLKEGKDNSRFIWKATSTSQKV